MKQILAVTPVCVDEIELARRQHRYDRLAPPGVHVRLVNLGIGSDIPHALENEEDIAASEAALIERFRGIDAAEVDAFLPDCVLDPTVGVQLPNVERPIYGILKLSAHFLHSQGASVGALARNVAIARELDRKLQTYGVGMPERPTAVLGLSVEDISDEEKWASSVARHLQDLHADYVINGCSAVEVRPDGSNSVLIDPTALALKLIGLVDSASSDHRGKAQG